MISSTEVASTYTATITRSATPSPTHTLTNTRTPSPTATLTTTQTPVPISAILYEDPIIESSLSDWSIFGLMYTIRHETELDYARFTTRESSGDWPGAYFFPESTPLYATWENYAFESNIRLFGGEIFVVARAGNDGHLNLVLDVKNGQINFDEDVHDRIDDPYQRIARKSFPIQINQWYLVRFEVENNNLRGFINDKLVISCERDTPISHGGIGYYIGKGGEFDIDNIRVWELK